MKLGTEIAKKRGVQIFSHFKKWEKPFEKSNILLGGRDQININFDAIDNCKTAIQNKIENICIHLNPKVVIPILIQTFGDCYENKNKILGVAIKRCIPFLWNGIRENTVGEKHSTKQILNLIEYNLFIQQLEEAKKLYLINPFSEISFSKRSMVPSPELMEAIKINNRVADYAAKHRTINYSVQYIWQNIIKFRDALICKVFWKTETNYFKGTLFEKVHHSNLKFWIPILGFIDILVYLINDNLEKIETAKDLSGLFYFDEILVFRYGTLSTKHENEIQKVIENCFWRRDWFNRRINENYPSEMVIERPLMRINSNKNRFITDPRIILDSINAFIENAIFRDNSKYPTHLSNSIFQEFVSEPFENEIVSLLRDLNFECGKVNIKGVWKTQFRNIKINNKNKCPGEIDVMGINKELKILIILECKVLRKPFTLNAMRNLIDKISGRDKEGFFYKLNKKFKWVLETPDLKLKNYRQLKSIVTDIPMPVKFDPNFTVIEKEQLVKILKDNKF